MAGAQCFSAVIRSPPRMPTPVASLLINTLNRKDDLRIALNSVFEQTVPLEVIVVDDGSTDGTSDMVRAEFPQVKMLRNEQPLGIIAARNRAAHEATHNIMFTMDDDATFSSKTTAERVLKRFDHPRVGAVTLPLIDHIEGVAQKPSLPISEETPADFPVTFAYTGGGNAKRRDLFLALGGYGGVGRQGEESNYCIKMLSAGYIVRIACAGWLNHYPIVKKRDENKIAYSGAMNRVIYTMQHVPFPEVVKHMAGVLVNQVRVGIRDGRLKHCLKGVWDGWCWYRANRQVRKPITSQVYQLSRVLVTKEALPFSEVEGMLPPMKTVEEIREMSGAG